MKAIIRRKGGEGSGNFGHSGRPGKVGGSTSELYNGVVTKYNTTSDIKKAIAPVIRSAFKGKVYSIQTRTGSTMYGVYAWLHPDVTAEDVKSSIGGWLSENAPNWAVEHIGINDLSGNYGDVTTVIISTVNRAGPEPKITVYQ